jgi:hypothetical protein
VGYRSDVRIIVSKNGYKELEKFVDKFLKEKNEDYNLLKETDIFKQSKYTTYLGWNSVKWYEYSYNDVDSIMQGLHYLKEKGMSYRYARIGENYDDYDEHYYESENEDEQDLEYPSMLREFEDEYVMSELDKQVEQTSDEVEI